MRSPIPRRAPICGRLKPRAGVGERLRGTSGKLGGRGSESRRSPGLPICGPARDEDGELRLVHGASRGFDVHALANRSRARLAR